MVQMGFGSYVGDTAYIIFELDTTAAVNWFYFPIAGDGNQWLFLKN